MKIKGVLALIVLDSRKQETIEVSINGCKSIAPAGKSTGKYEAKSYIQDVEGDVKTLNSLKLNLEVNNLNDLVKVEKVCNGKIGANSLFALEASILKALAKEKGKELWQLLNSKAEKFPRILSNTIGGGAHAAAKKKTDFQEFLVTCNKDPDVAEVVNRDAYTEAGVILLKIDGSIFKNDENAWQTTFSNEKTLEVLKEVQEDVFDETGMHLDVGLDVASSQFYKNGSYVYQNDKKIRTREEQIAYIANLIKKYNLFYVEDPLDEEDFCGFAELLKMTKGKCLITGDDLTTTNLERTKKAIKMKSINAMIIKPNQIGSLIEVKKVIDLCKKNKIYTIMSHRSGETLDNTLADLSFAWQCDFIKIPVIGVERLAKVNRLKEIEKSMYRKK